MVSKAVTVDNGGFSIRRCLWVQIITDLDCNMRSGFAQKPTEFDLLAANVGTVRLIVSRTTTPEQIPIVYRFLMMLMGIRVET